MAIPISKDVASGIAQNLARVKERIAEAALRAGRDPAEVTLLAVSKTFSAAAVLEAFHAGQRDFGENRVEEALPKMREVETAANGIRWHLIGHVQSRKAKDAAAFGLIHSVDSLNLAQKLNARGQAINHKLDVLLECNMSGEASKDGFPLSTGAEPFMRDVAQIVALPFVRVHGLMTMAPIVDDPAQARPVFAALRHLRDGLRNQFPSANWDTLSMGMSDDFEAAIAEGATMVRLGRAIFGTRQ